MIRINKVQFLGTIILSLIIFSCSNSTENKTTNENSSNTDSLMAVMPDSATIAYRVFMNDSTDKSKGFGYEITGGMHIIQKTIPAVNGNQNFQLETDAAKVAALVCNKIQHKIEPTVTVHELDSLGVTVNKMQ